MLIIGHRGSAGTKPENTIAGLREAIRVGADMVEFDVRITKDGHPVLSHDFSLYRSHKKLNLIATSTLDEIQKRTAGSALPIVTLQQALKECYGKIFINIEIKRLSAVKPTFETLKALCHKRSDWESILVSSFNPLILKKMRKLSKHVQLSMLHHVNSLDFIVWERQLHLSAVGFHRLHINAFALKVAEELDLFTYAYTVNRADTAKRLASRGIQAIVTDYPKKLITELT